jgi:outer membrane protein, multidrug efflux system
VFKVTRIVILCSIFLASCLGPQDEYKKPLVVPNVWDARDQQFAIDKKNLACFAWWRKFNDPALNNLVSHGLTKNNDIHVAMANIEAAQGELKRIALNWVPGVGGNLGFSSFPDLGYPGVLLTAVPSYTLNIFTQIKEQERAKYELKISENIRSTVQLAVITEIVANYFGYLAEKEHLELLQQLGDDLKQIVTVSKAGYQGGLFTDIDLAKTKTEFDLIESEKNMIRKNIVIHRNAIRYLLNQNPKELLHYGEFKNLDIHHQVVGSLPLNIIENRPDMRQALYDLQASNASVAISQSHFLPNIQLSAARGNIATESNGRTLGQPIYFNQALLQMPLLTLTTFGEWDKAAALSKASYYKFQDKLRMVLREVNDDLAAHEYFSQSLMQTSNAKNHVNEAYQLQRNLYHKGIVSYLQLLEDRVVLDKINIQVNAVKRDELLSVVHLYQDLAAGYDCMVVCDTVKKA